ncbi:NAD-binding protein [Rivularia sp. UHCC 0363]|uniref:NAD-binding protein n=1 Tax=Rivularia sp. UHCC 0363 TaxID=3110244 RepID=UPI002B1FBD94|nr:NAD-binding protein [Rivularia sp. UHCC 0363]MEA5593593.1 NAD-binding protein [Rivularia sp. UHCC 0363]
MSSSEQQNQSALNSHFIVCGLGSLGQHCIKLLKDFGVPVIAIDKQEKIKWEVDGIPNSIKKNYLVGDIQDSEVLVKANIKECRAILIVTNDEIVNVKVADEINKLNPQARMIIRSSKKDLHEKSKLNIDNVVVCDPTELPAQVFATRALGDENRGFFKLEDEWLGVLKVKIHPHHKWRNRQLHQINTKECRILCHIPARKQLPTLFHKWKPNLILYPNDEVVYIEIDRNLVHWYGESDCLSSEWKNKGFKQKIIDFLSKFKREKKALAFKEWIKHQLNQPIIRIVFLTWLILFVIGVVILTFGFKLPLWKAFYSSAVMLLGGYDDVYIEAESKVVELQRLMNFIYMLSGILLMGVLQAWLTQWVLNEKFQQLFAYPKRNHIVVVGLSSLGEKIADFLQKWQQPVFAINDKKVKGRVLPQMQLLIGNFIDNLQKIDVANAKSVVVVTDNEDDNIDIGLKAYKANPNCTLIIRTFDHYKTNEIKEYLPYAKVINDYELSAEVFVSNAFGKHIRNMLRMNEQTILVAEYTIKPGDTLNGCFLFEIAYGYEVVPILYQTYKQVRPKIMPSYWDKSPLESGDRIVILANFDSLQKIEIGDRQLPDCKLRVKEAPSQDVILKAAAIIAFICGCNRKMARKLMDNLPGTLDYPIYKHQGQLLLRKLKKYGVDATLVEN